MRCDGPGIHRRRTGSLRMLSRVDFRGEQRCREICSRCKAGRKEDALWGLPGQRPGALLLFGQLPWQERIELVEGLSSILGAGIEIGQQYLVRIEPVAHVGLRQGEDDGGEDPTPHRPTAVVVFAADYRSAQALLGFIRHYRE